jgi:hypothetical protein
MMWCCWCSWLGFRGSVASGRRRGQAAAELELTGTTGDDARVRESEIRWVSELQGVTQCSRSTGLGVGGGVGGGRRRPEVAAEVR